jgi:hypothetical protein
MLKTIKNFMTLSTLLAAISCGSVKEDASGTLAKELIEPAIVTAQSDKSRKVSFEMASNEEGVIPGYRLERATALCPSGDEVLSFSADEPNPVLFKDIKNCPIRIDRLVDESSEGAIYLWTLDLDDGSQKLLREGSADGDSLIVSTKVFSTKNCEENCDFFDVNLMIFVSELKVERLEVKAPKLKCRKGPGQSPHQSPVQSPNQSPSQRPVCKFES